MNDRARKIPAFVRAATKTVVLCVLAVLAILAIYLGAAVTGTVWTASPDENTASGGQITVYVLSNGFHSDIAIPVLNGRPPNGIPVSEADLPGGLQNTQYLVIGWGSQTAYTSLLALSDLTAGIVFKALLFDRSVMHVLPVAGTPYGDGIYRLELDDAQYRRLVRFIAETFKTNGAGNAELLTGITQGFGDVFYRARPRFSAFYGCNAWTGHALRAAGVPVGRWTPFAQSIEWNMTRLQSGN
ncbi:TIGR02117 family protein [Hoeflea sp. TYP-13]|uniref:TIGR02117 family protein n=1 Tax=Hoeflea sp. TYP-13 TaxID=3230023 RepID=UPI0034C6012F